MATFSVANSQNFSYTSGGSQTFTVTFSGIDTLKTQTVDCSVYDYNGNLLVVSNSISAPQIGSTAVATVNLSINQIGWFKVNVVLKENGFPVTTTNSNIARVDNSNTWFPFAIVDGAFTSSSDSPFGVAEHSVTSSYIDSMKKLGIKYHREDTRSHIVYPSANTYSWTNLDQKVNDLDAEGLIFFPLISYGFSGSLSTKPSETTPERWQPIIDPHWNNYITAMVNRYKAKLHYWEVWNEANIGFWLDTQANFWALLTATYDAIKLEDSTATVLHGGVSGSGNSSWLDDLNASSASSDFDIYNIHPYCYTSSPESSSSFYTGIQDSAIQSKPRWITEFGFPTYGGGNTYQEQAKYSIRALVIALQRGYEKFFFYEAVDGGVSDSASANSTIKEQNFGIVHNNLAPKPLYSAYANCIRKLYGKKPINLTVDGQVYFATFSDKDKSVIVIWTTGNTVDYSINISDFKNIAVYDMMGKTYSYAISSNNNTVDLDVIGEPSYIEVTHKISPSNLNDKSITKDKNMRHLNRGFGGMNRIDKLHSSLRMGQIAFL